MHRARACCVGFGVTNQAVADALTRHGSRCRRHRRPRRRTTSRVGRHQPRSSSSSSGPIVRTYDELVRGVERRAAVTRHRRHARRARAGRAGTACRSAASSTSPSEWNDRPVLAITGTDGKTTVTTLVTDMLARVGRAGGRGRQQRGAAGDGHRRPDDRRVRGRGVVVPARPQRALRARASALAQLRARPPEPAPLARTPTSRPRPGSGGISRPTRSPSVQPTTRSCSSTCGRPVRDRSPSGSAPTPTSTSRAGMLVTADGETVGRGRRAVARRSRTTCRTRWPRRPRRSQAAPRSTASTTRSVSFRGLPHRIELVGEQDDVRWYDDSKATTPHATAAAHPLVRVGGADRRRAEQGPRPRASSPTEAPRIRAVVAIGEAAAEVEQSFAGVRPVVVARSMDDAVAQAATLARAGDAVLLSPACASFDWYKSYGERGDDFAARVRDLIGASR